MAMHLRQSDRLNASAPDSPPKGKPSPGAEPTQVCTSQAINHRLCDMDRLRD